MKICPKHELEMRMVSTKHGPLWLCPAERCNVICWNGPYSTPAGSLLRALRQEVHQRFDPLWKPTASICGARARARQRAYKWLQETMELPPAKCHVGMFNVVQCKAALSALRSLNGEL